jgi:CHAT domain-containing protein
MQGVRLLALSACSTAVGEGGEGRELESFATLAQRMGATAVLASLWEVADLSTSVLMSRFYRSRQETGRDDALAIARAQRSFLEPATRETWGHPFYWAPFLILAAR